MAEPPTDKQAAGIPLVLASTIAFAVGPTAARLALDDGSNTLTVVTLRGVVGAALMALLVPLRSSSRCPARASASTAARCGGASTAASSTP